MGMIFWIYLVANTRCARLEESILYYWYSGWYNVIEKENKHIGNTYLSYAAQEVWSKIKVKTLFTLYLRRMALSKRCKKYPIILRATEWVIYLLGKRGQALRGHQEDISSNSKNPGSFLMLLRQIALCNPILAEHLNTPLSKNATSWSHLSQNVLMEETGMSTIQSELIEEITRAKCFSIMADEVTTQEILSKGFHYVDQNEKIR